MAVIILIDSGPIVCCNSIMRGKTSKALDDRAIALSQLIKQENLSNFKGPKWVSNVISLH